jgi:hypothetical protein
MIVKFRKPPEVHRPQTSRWEAVFKVSPNAEIWMLNLRKALPYGFYPVFCDLVNDKPIPRYDIPLTPEELSRDSRLVSGWGNRFFWSETSKTFLVQLLETHEPSNRPDDVEQIVFSGSDFKIRKILKAKDIIFMPNSEFQEVYPEMHPDRST